MKASALFVAVWTLSFSAGSPMAIESKKDEQLASPKAEEQRPARAQRTVSSGIAEVLSMTERGVEPSVIKSFVENYPIAYNPTADEIIALHEAGVSSDIITALLRRTGEMRTKQLEAHREALAQRSEVRKPLARSEAPQNYAPAAPAPAPAAPSVTYVYPSYVAPVYPTYWYNYSPPLYYSSWYSYRPYRYSYHYPRSYCWPSWPSWRAHPSYGLSVGYRHHFGSGFRFHTSFGGFSGRFGCR